MLSLSLFLHDAGESDGLWHLICRALRQGHRVNILLSQFAAEHKRRGYRSLQNKFPEQLHTRTGAWGYAERDTPLSSKELNECHRWVSDMRTDVLISGLPSAKQAQLMRACRHTYNIVYLDLLGYLDSHYIRLLRAFENSYHEAWVTSRANQERLLKTQPLLKVISVGHGNLSSSNRKRLRTRLHSENAEHVKRILWIGSYDTPADIERPHKESDAFTHMLPTLKSLYLSGITFHVAIHPGAQVEPSTGRYFHETCLLEHGFSELDIAKIILRPGQRGKTEALIPQYHFVLTYYSTLADTALMLGIPTAFVAHPRSAPPEAPLQASRGLAGYFVNPDALRDELVNILYTERHLSSRHGFFHQRGVRRHPGETMLQALPSIDYLAQIAQTSDGHKPLANHCGLPSL